MKRKRSIFIKRPIRSIPLSNQLLSRGSYQCFYPVTTRWNDNDTYGHVNNVVYYSYFDSAVNRFLIEQGGLDIHRSDIVAYVVNSQCHYLAPISYPEQIEVGMSVKKLGTSSVTYSVAIFKAGETSASAHGDFVHVFVDQVSNKAVPIPAHIRDALEGICLQ